MTRSEKAELNIKSRAGMTLVEVLVAMAIFAAVAVPLFAMFSNSMKMERRALVESLTTYTAQMMIEEAYGNTTDQLKAKVTEPGEPGEYTVVLSEDGEDSIELYYTFYIMEKINGTDLTGVTITVGSEYFEVETRLEAMIRPIS